MCTLRCTYMMLYKVFRSGNSLTVLIDRHRLEALIQNHQRAGGIEADATNLVPLHTLGNFLEQIHSTERRYGYMSRHCIRNRHYVFKVTTRVTEKGVC